MAVKGQRGSGSVKSSITKDKAKSIQVVAGRRIKLARKALNKTQEDLCGESVFLDKIGRDFDQRTLRRYESGNIPLKRIPLFAAYFRISPDDLIDPGIGDEVFLGKVLTRRSQEDEVHESMLSPGKVLFGSSSSGFFKRSDLSWEPSAGMVNVIDAFTADPEKSVALGATDVVIILQSIVRDVNVEVHLKDRQILIGDAPLSTAATHYSRVTDYGLKSRIALLAERLGFPNVSLDALIPFWEKEISKGVPISGGKLIQMGKDAALWEADANGADTLSEWRGRSLNGCSKPFRLCAPLIDSRLLPRRKNWRVFWS
jgi:transcriptional regulator with XRE-family HTH domain